ncbi:nuclear transport factor 2 [Dendrothele bispora CBS 962.96]|uniref:Nuclear transport factor 2 n=1 Tax=Dendrothele bispora (strain CBS 962.96) TaxID=1314807 RepID=A0A4S8MX76_DENBC|nr:nuclear transport factor 2 [Dendrothele bispora CBS 962.96]
MSDINDIAKQFVNFYYTTFDNDRSQLGPLYRTESMLTWEGSPIQGVNAVLEKLVSLPFQKVAHKIETLDAQPSSPTMASILVSVTGALKVDDGESELKFSQVFNLIPDGGSYFVQNDIFRLNYG